MSDEQKDKPPYLPYTTFKNVIGNLNKNGIIPARIDKTVLAGQSGGMQSWLWAALRFFDLMDENKAPTDDLKALARADSDQRQAIWRKIFDRAYNPIIGDLELASATLGMLQDKFTDQGLSSETARKCHSFYTAAAADAGVELPPQLKANARPSGTRRTRRKSTKTNGSSENDMPDVDDFGDPQDGNSGASQKEPTRTYSLPLDGEARREVKLKVPATLTSAELERIKNWLGFQVIIDDSAGK